LHLHHAYTMPAPHTALKRKLQLPAHHAMMMMMTIYCPLHPSQPPTKSPKR
jgi:hypothetical protein